MEVLVAFGGFAVVHDEVFVDKFIILFSQLLFSVLQGLDLPLIDPNSLKQALCGLFIAEELLGQHFWVADTLNATMLTVLTLTVWKAACIWAYLAINLLTFDSRSVSATL